MSAERVDFFISHAGSDRAWAEWVAWQLTEAGYQVELDVWDWAAGDNFVKAMSDALDRCDRVVALFSKAYFDRDRYTTEEFTAAVLHMPGKEEGRLLPVRVEDVPEADMPALLRPLAARNLFGMAEDQARRELLEAVRGPRRPDQEPVFPGHGTPRAFSRLGAPGPQLPGSMPRIWNIPARNPGFTGRDVLLVAIREPLQAGGKTVAALQGMGGVGKTQLAIEYAHRFAGTYGLAWWVRAEQAGLIGQQFAALGSAMGVEAGAGTEAVRSAVLGELRARGRWLLVFDSAEHPRDVRDWLPGGSGHVLITSREPGWGQIADPVFIGVLAPPESVVILRDRVGGLSDVEANQLATELGNLPLAVSQAAGFMGETGMPAAEYLDLLKTRAAKLLDKTPPESDQRSLAAVTQLIADRLAHDDPAAAELANMCAFLAPDPIPGDLFTGAAAELLPDELAARAADPLEWRSTLAKLTRQSLALIDHRGILLHRLTQAILRDRLTPAQAAATRSRAEAIVAGNHPGDASDPATWPRWARLMPHVLAIDLAATDEYDLRELACGAAWYLLKSGAVRESRDLADGLYQQWKDRPGLNDRSGPDDHHSMWAASILAYAFRQMGDYEKARELDADTHERNRRLYGDEHPRTTLISASNLANDLRGLGDAMAAHDLDEDTLARRRRVLTDDHPDTLGSASNLAADLRALGQVQAAHDLDEDTLARRRRVLGPDHADTRLTARNLDADMRVLREADYDS